MSSLLKVTQWERTGLAFEHRLSDRTGCTCKTPLPPLHHITERLDGSGKANENLDSNWVLPPTSHVAWAAFVTWFLLHFIFHF